MKICVVLTEPIRVLPPALNVIGALLASGHDVTVIAYDTDGLDVLWGASPKLTVHSLGVRANSLRRKFEQNLATRRILRNYFTSATSREIDFVWTMSDLTARECGEVLLRHRHIMFLAELIEAVPALANRLLGRRQVIIKDRTVERLANSAYRVVVPERNRAYIQKLFWGLDKLPHVIPNKPFPVPQGSRELDKQRARLDPSWSNGGYLDVLYQGVFAADRDFEAFAEAVEKLGPPFRLILMGNPTNNRGREAVTRLCDRYKGTQLVRFVPPPGHFKRTASGYIGILPYSPTGRDRFSPLNPLYCAPNKIWEYSAFGLPVIGSDVPGLVDAVEGCKMGILVPGTDSDAIACAIDRIRRNYMEFSRASYAFFDSVDVQALVEEAMR